MRNSVFGMRNSDPPGAPLSSSDFIPHSAFRIPHSSLYPFHGHTLDRPGGRLHFLDEGAGDPVVMLHGNPTWGFYYRNLVTALRDEYRCVVPDHIGYGLSDKPP